MMYAEIGLAVLVVVQGLAISWQWAQIKRYRFSLSMATYALEAAYDHIIGEEKDED